MVGAAARVMVGLLLVAAACGGAQVAAPLEPAGIAYDAQGDLYIADAARNQVYESTVGGVLRVVAGTGVQGFGGDGGTAAGAMLNRPVGVAVGADGTLYIADTGNERVRAVSVTGVIATVAGDGVRGFGGDGGMAMVAELDEPSGVAVGVGGVLLIADRGNERVRAVSDGVITTFAGDGVEGFAGDGGAAIAAELDGPVAVACASDGRVFVVDARNERVRVVAGDGTIATFAGTGVAGFAGDGGAAVAAELFGPRGVAVLADGSVLIADAGNRRVRMVGVNGVISTIAGSGVQGASGEGVAGGAASLNEARAVGVSGFGAPVFADLRGRVVRALLGNGELYGAAGLVAARTSSVKATVPASVVYGGGGTVGVVVSGAAATPMGGIVLVEDGKPVGSGTLAAGGGSFGLGMLPVGTHSLSMAYAGDGFNPAAVSGVMPVVVAQASTTVSARAAGAYAGLPMTLTAVVTPEFAGVPMGTVVFEENGSAVASAAVVGGVATGVYLAPAAGMHSLMAVYSGDADFVGSTSVAVTATVVAMPDFSLAVSGSAAQTVQVGSVATYGLNVVAQSGAFSSVVSLSASGLPAGSAVMFSPAEVVPGTGGVSVVMSVPTAGLLAQRGVWGGVLWALLPVGLLVFVRRRRAAVLLCAVVMLVGCGTRTVSEGAVATRSYAIHVTATATSLSGALLTHAVDVSLMVE